MSRTFERFDITGMWRINTDPDIYCADLEFRFNEEIDDDTYGHTVSIRIRVKHNHDNSIQSLEQRIFEEARSLIVQTVQHIAEESAESLFEKNREKELAARAVEFVP